MIWSMAIEPIAFERETVGHILKDKLLYVPLNQRSYRWEKEHVLDLLNDTWDSVSDDEFFLGSIVIVRSGDKLEINDGQQRLATSAILIAAIRDYFLSNDDEKAANKLQRVYLLSEDDISTDEPSPRLHLNTRDHDFFQNRILFPPSDSKRKTVKETKASHKRITRASELAAEFIDEKVSHFDKSTARQRLLSWVTFLEKSARVVWVEVANERTAYIIFETMNDRGLKLSSADLLKNRIFGQADERLPEAVEKWQGMVGHLESLDDGESTVVDYIRYLWITEHGPIRSRLLYDKVRDSIRNKNAAITFVGDLERRASDYAALVLPSHEKWAKYDKSVRQHVETLNVLGAKQVRVMLLAALPIFSAKEMSKLLRACACWSARGLLSGVSSGTLEGYYGRIAHKIAKKEIKTVQQVSREMLPIIPNDRKFETDVATANVAQSGLALYYLRALQRKADGDPEPEYVPSDGGETSREHVMPQKRGPEWKHIPEDTAKANLNRLGNQALLKVTTNSTIGNVGFDDKKQALAASKYSLTQTVAKEKKWDIATIDKRQNELAKLAVKTWPLRHQ